MVNDPADARSGTAGEALGRYQLVHKLAHGGMATVYLATFSGPGGFKKVVALKRIHPHLAEEPAFVNMFLDEARIASRIHHANVCQVNDFGESDGTYFIAMEYLIGEPLSRVLGAIARNDALFANPAQPFLACRLIADACEGLHAAHELRDRDGTLLNVVHRDISPQNLFVTYDGNVKVVDFGIASASDRLHHTEGGQIKGKFSYMAPEQATSTGVDRRADVWSLGVVLWEFLTMRRLFHSENAVNTLRSMLNREIPPPSTMRSDIPIPEELDRIALKALSRDPEDRYPTARALGRELARVNSRSEEPATIADVAEWMEKLFPDGRKRTYDVMEAVERGEMVATVVDTTPPPGASDPAGGESAIHAREAGAPARSVRPAAPSVRPPREPSEPSIPSEPSATPLLGPNRPRRVGLFAAVGAGSVLGLAIVALVIAAMARSGNPDSAAATEERVLVVDPPAALPVGSAPVAQADSIEGDPSPPEPEATAIPDPSAVTTEAENGLDGEPVAGPLPAPSETSSDVESSAEARRRARRERAEARESRRTRPPSGSTMEADEPAPAAPTTGVVAFFTPGGWANVHGRGGRLLGQTPARLTLPPGEHELEVRPFGQPPGRRVRVTVTAGETTRVVHPLSE